jgi:hypothetical protein
MRSTAAAATWRPTSHGKAVPCSAHGWCSFSEIRIRCGPRSSAACPGSTSPTPRSNTLTDYILTVYQSPKVDRDSMPLTGYPPAQVELGRQLYYSKYGCQACHIIDTKQDKGYIGPTLDACWLAAHRSLGLQLDEGPSGSLRHRHAGTEAQHELTTMPAHLLRFS